MRKIQSVALTAALAILAGSFCMPAGQQEASGQEGIASSSSSYEEAIADLYARSADISNEEILSIAKTLTPSAKKLEARTGSEEAEAILKALTDYEAQKVSYILDGEGGRDNSEITAEWDLQRAYSNLGLTQDETLTTVIPGFDITSIDIEKDGASVTASADIDEWITEGYVTDGAADGAQDVTAYRYYFTANLEKSKEGGWTVVSVTDTEQNYAWLEDIEDQQAKFEALAGEAGDAAAAGGADGIEAAQGSGISTLKTYGASQYTYSPDKAIAYADKWATSRNPKYKSYPGVDCANFVSQCIRAGGMPTNSKWYPASYAWVNCMGAISNFKKYGKFMEAKNSNVLRGNPVYYDWNSDGTYDHTAICVGKNSAGVPIVDAHTGDHYHATWSLGSNGKRATIQLRGTGTTGTSTKGSWKKKDGKWYYYDTSGKAVKGWLTYKGKQYYLSDNGRMVTGWKSINGSWYYFGKEGDMRTGWITLGSRKFYLQENGKMKTGWAKKGSSWYYLCDEGYALKNTWTSRNGNRCYLGSDGAMAVGLTKVDGLYYYFDNEGRITLNWVTVNGRKYFFSTSAGGRAATGYWDINGRIYHFSDEGVLID